MSFAEWEGLSSSFVQLAFETVLRSSVLAILCASVVFFLRSRAAELRFSVWKWLLAALLLMPVLIQLAPPIHKTSRALERVNFMPPPIPFATAHQGPQSYLEQNRVEGEPPAHILILGALTAYLVITASLLSRLLFSLYRLRRLEAASEPISELAFRELALDVWLKSLASFRPRIAESEHVSAPVTFESDQPCILLPPSWREWSEEKLRVVLTHEIAHVRRADCQTLLLASVATCVFWFHPLAWFVKRQLRDLAEQACDELVVASETSPERYAGYLIDFVHDVELSTSGLISGGVAFARSSRIERRIQRIFTPAKALAGPRRMLAALTLTLFLPAIYLTAAVRFDEAPNQADSPDRRIVWPNYVGVLSLSPTEVAESEAKLDANPEDLDTRMELLIYYGYNNKTLYSNHLVWFIEHHPEIETLSMATGMFGHLASEDAGTRALVSSAWEQAMIKHAGSAAVLANAASFIRMLDPERGIDLLRKAKALDQAHPREYDKDIASIYAAAEFQEVEPNGRINAIEMAPESGAKLRADLQSQNDSALWTEVGRMLCSLLYPPNHGEAPYQRGLELIQQAIQIDPENHASRDALDWAQHLPELRRAQEIMRQAGTPRPGVVRIGEAVAEANLLKKADPVYPPLARSARVQGTVEFTVTVGSNGKVDHIELVRGHPLLVNAAKEAVAQWEYHPASVDGQPIPFETQVLVTFRLDQ